MPEAAWTWMIYLATHNNVAEAGEESVACMRRAQLNDDVRVLVQRSDPKDTCRCEIATPPQSVVDLGPNVDSGAPETVVDFVRWAKETAPAQRYALVLWSHGSGWEPSEIERLTLVEPPAEPVTADEFTERGAEDEGRQVFFSSTMRRLIARPTRRERAVAFDDGSGHSLDTIELGQLAAGAHEVLGQPVDLLGMNACQMSNAEVAYQVRDDARVYVASEEDMPVESLPYDDILTRLAAQPDMEVEAVGRLVVERYCEFYRNSSVPWGKWGMPKGATLAAVALEKAQALADATESLAAALNADMEGQLPAVWDAQKKAHKFKFRLYDLGSFCRPLAEHAAASSDTVKAAQAVLAALEDPAFMLARDHTSPSYDDVAGLTTYLMAPSFGRSMSPHYAETEYAQDTGWGEFIAAYHAAAL
jgi:hypothetical protein